MKRDQIPEIAVFRNMLEEAPRSLLQDNFYDFTNAERREQSLFRMASAANPEYLLAYRDWKIRHMQREVQERTKELQAQLDDCHVTGDETFDIFFKKIRNHRFDYRYSQLEVIRNHVLKEALELEAEAIKQGGVYLNVWNIAKFKQFKKMLEKHDWHFHMNPNMEYYKDKQFEEDKLLEYAYEQGQQYIDLYNEYEKKGSA